MERILLIGGTGMLLGATTYFCSKNKEVVVLARNKLTSNNQRITFPIKSLVCDYHHTEKFISIIQDEIKEKGAFDTIVIWMHSSAKSSLVSLLSFIDERMPKTIIYHIKGSNYSTYNDLLQVGSKLIYREIILGSQTENGIKRWLTNTEISDGVINALTTEANCSVVGYLE
ncbi:MAG: hypothetical protein J0M08_00345 [Bacteroidetes bacterium]|nr:hypothetical protein [Bacteroidota bacterium]